MDVSESSLNFLNGVSVTPESPISGDSGEIILQPDPVTHFSSYSYAWPQRQAGIIEQMLGPELAFLGLYQGYVYRYKQAMLSDKVCLPGESYIEFVGTMKGREGTGARSKLVSWASKCAERLGCGTIRLTVMGDTPSSKDRFERDGFVVSMSWTDPIAVLIMRYVFGIKEDCYFEMEKPLGVDSGVALHSDAWGYQNDRIALSDSGSSHHSIPDDLSNSLHDIAHNLLENTRDLIHTARGFFKREDSTGAVPEYGHKYSAVFSPILRTCISDSTHDGVDAAISALPAAKTTTVENNSVRDDDTGIQQKSTEVQEDDSSVCV